MDDKKELYNQRRKNNPQRQEENRRRRLKLTVAIILCLLVLALIIFFSTRSHAVAHANPSLHTDSMLCVKLPDGTPEVRKQYEGFTVSFNPEKHIPNYVAWELTGDKAFGSAERVNKFYSDPEIPGCPTVDDYKNSGFDRGHMAPAADMKWSSKAMTESHFLTNICPQNHALNSGLWNTLENNCRRWAVADSCIVIIAGPILTDVLPRKIGASEVVVPERFFKILFAPYSEPPRAIGFVMTNSGDNQSLYDCSTSVDNIEAMTGMDFFAELPDEIEIRVEASDNYHVWTSRNNRKNERF